MLSANGADGAHDSERSPLLGRQNSDRAAGVVNKGKREGALGSSNPFTVDSTNPRFRRVPVLACLVVLIWELDFFIKSVNISLN